MSNENDLKVRTFKLHWLEGKIEVVKTQPIAACLSSGSACAHACSHAGIGNGALAAMDYWEEIPETQEHKDG